MRKQFKSVIVLGTVFTLMFSSLMCCCFSNIASAKETVAACHQSVDHDQSTNQQDSQECQCQQIVSVAGDQAINVADLSVLKHQFPVISFHKVDSIIPLSVAYQVPPVYLKNPIPSYIQKTVLRI